MVFIEKQELEMDVTGQMHFPRGYDNFEDEDRLETFPETPKQELLACLTIYHLCNTNVRNGQVLAFDTFEGLCEHELRLGRRLDEISALEVDIKGVPQRIMESLQKYFGSFEMCPPCERIYNAHLIFGPFERARVIRFNVTVSSEM